MIFIFSLIALNFMLVLITSGYILTATVLYYLITIFGFFLCSNDSTLRSLHKTLRETDPNIRNKSDYVAIMQSINYSELRGNIIGASLIHIGIAILLLHSFVLPLMMAALLYVRIKNSQENERFYNE